MADQKDFLWLGIERAKIDCCTRNHMFTFKKLLDLINNNIISHRKTC